MGWWKSISSFFQGPSEVFVPWVSFQSDAGDPCNGPLLRTAIGRRELLTWTDAEGATRAAQTVTEKTGGTYEVLILGREEVARHCRTYSTPRSRVVAVILRG
jgi:hypothetical protein